MGKMGEKQDVGGKSVILTLLAALLAALIAVSCGGPTSAPATGNPPPATIQYSLVELISGLTNPVDLQLPPDDTDRIFVVEQEGIVRVIQGGVLLATPFIDIRARVTSGGDPQGNGQNMNTLLGKLLRIEIDSSQPYAVPADNPFVGQNGIRQEIWASGLRNPWRFSFDRTTGRLFVADVGQDSFEEVDLVVKGGNYGWNIMEGLHCFNPPSGCSTSGLELPIAEYSHSEGASVTGGFVYRGALMSELRGRYIFGDFISGRIWSLDETLPGIWTRSLLLDTDINISCFGVDRTGELLVSDYGGRVLRLRKVT
jgi:glucose/arabinose dehydrogenase